MSRGLNAASGSTVSTSWTGASTKTDEKSMRLNPSGVVGWALDGFPIYGPVLEDGSMAIPPISVVSSGLSPNLDECWGVETRIDTLRFDRFIDLQTFYRHFATTFTRTYDIYYERVLYTSSFRNDLCSVACETN